MTMVSLWCVCVAQPVPRQAWPCLLHKWCVAPPDRQLHKWCVAPPDRQLHRLPDDGQMGDSWLMHAAHLTEWHFRFAAADHSGSK